MNTPFLAFFRPDGIVANAILLAPLAAFGTVAAGAIVLRWASSALVRSEVAAAAPLVGFSLASVWFNLIGITIGWEAAIGSWLAISIACLVRFPRVWHEIEDDPDWPRLRRAWKWIVPPLAILAAVGGIFDEGWHFPLSALIANGHWPAQFPFDPSVSLTYHFGFDIVVAAFSRYGWWIPLASDLWAVALQTSLALLAYLVFRSWIAEPKSRWLAVGLWFFAGSFGWILRPFRAFLPAVLQPVPPFHSTIGNALGLVTYTKSMFAAAGFVLCLLLFARRSEFRSWRGGVLLILGLAAAALSSETLFVTVIACLLIGLFVELPARQRGPFVMAVSIAAVIVGTQGGLLTDLVTSHLPGAAGAHMKQTEILVRGTPVFKTFGDQIDLTSPWSWVRILVEWGGQAVLAGVAFWNWKRWKTMERLACIGAAFAFAIPFLFVYPATPHDLIRFFWNGFLVTNLFGAAVFAPALMRNRRTKILAGAFMISGAASMVLSNIPLIPWMAPIEPKVVSPALWGTFLRGDRLPRGSVIWTSVPHPEREIPSEVREVPLVFGAYAKSCYDFSNDTHGFECQSFYATPTASGLRDLRVTHLLLREDWLVRHRDGEWMSGVTLLKEYHAWWWARYAPDVWTGARDGSLYLYRVNTPGL